MHKAKSKKQKSAIKRGILFTIIGMVILVMYLTKWFPLDPVENMPILAAWSYTGGAFGMTAVLAGLCELLIKGDL